MIKRKLAKMAPFFQSAMVVLIASLFVISVVYAATTIGSNVNTGGTLTATGETHLTGQVFATSTIYFDNATSTGDLKVGAKATATTALWVGAGGTADRIGLSGGDLYVQDAAEIDGDLFISGGTASVSTGTPTTTAGLFVGPTGTTGTSTVGIGNAGQAGCLELTREGAWYRCYLNTTGDGIACVVGRCN